MSSTPREIGTLIAVILKAKNLPNKRHIGKQDPYCVVILNGEKRRTRAIKRGGQHPEWDQEVRFTLYEDVEDELARTTDNIEEPPPPPPKDGRKLRKIKGGKTMLISCWDDSKEPDLIGEGTVDLTEVLTKGETDEWFTIMNKDKYCGEVYLELTFWSNEKPPERKSGQNSIKPQKQYGGPGSFVPAEDIQDSNINGSNIPPSLRSSSSLATLDLYVPPYDTNAQRTDKFTIDRITDEFGTLGIDGIRRRGSFPPTHPNHTPRPLSDVSFSSMHSLPIHYSQEYSAYDHINMPSAYSYDPPDRPETPTGHSTYRHSSFSYSASELPQIGQPYYNASHEISHLQGDPNGQQFPSEHLRLSSVATSASSGFVSTPSSSGFVLQQSNPGPPGFPTPSSISSPLSFHSQSSLSLTSPTFVPPIHPSTSMGFHPQSAGPVLQSLSYHPYSQSPVSNHSQVYTTVPQLSSVPSQSHSAPPTHQFRTPSQSSSSSSQTFNPSEYPNYVPNTPSPPHMSTLSLQYSPSPPTHSSSRPLPQPGQQHQYGTLPSSLSSSSTINNHVHVPVANTSYRNGLNGITYNPLPNPPPPPPPLNHKQQYQPNGHVVNLPPPPPPLAPSLGHTPASHPQYQYPIPVPDMNQSHLGLPQPPVSYSLTTPPVLPNGLSPPPPPPPIPQRTQQHPLPPPPSYTQNEVHYSEHLPRPPSEHAGGGSF